MLKPHVTVAYIVHAEDKFLVAEGTVNSKALWNQPARHLEAGEALVQAATCELWGEADIRGQSQHFIRVYQWIASDRTPFLCFLFSIEPANMCATEPHDNDMDCCRWVNAEEIFSAPNLRSPLVAEGVRYYQGGQRYPLAVISEFNQSFTKGVKQRAAY